MLFSQFTENLMRKNGQRNKGQLNLQPPFLRYLPSSLSLNLALHRAIIPFFAIV
jgi:hypothetical protein